MKKLFLLFPLLAMVLSCEESTLISLSVSNQKCGYRSEALIHSSINGYKLYKEETDILSFDRIELESSVDRYWQAIPERTFEILVSDAFNLLKNCDDQHFGILFKNLDSPVLLEAEWGKFSDYTLHQSDVCNAFFLIDHSLLTELTYQLKQDDFSLIVRVGSDPDQNPISYFLIENRITKGGGVISGARIPRGG